MYPLPFQLSEHVRFAPKRVPPLALAVLAQLLALLMCGLAAWLAQVWAFPLNLGAVIIIQSVCSSLFSFVLRMQIWWLFIQALFVPTMVVTLSFQLAPGWYLAGFVGLVLVYWSTFTTQVPWYLSRRHVWRQVHAQLPDKPGLRCIDLGSGLGGGVRYLARMRPNSHFNGIEAAPLPCWIGKLRTVFQANAAVTWGDFWQHNLRAYDVVFAYLSPIPMPELWLKVQQEMRPGTLFISYRFTVPGVVPSAVVELSDLGRTQLFLWRL